MGHGEGHSDATCTLVKDGLLSPWMLWKWHRNCCARLSGLCYAQNQTRCSLTVFKFSYNKILSCFPFSLNVRNISFQSPATFFFFFSSREPAFSTEKIQRSFLFSEIYSFLLLTLWTMRNDSGCLKSCSHWQLSQPFWLPCENSSQLFGAATSTYKPESPQSVSIGSPFLNLVICHERGFEPKPVRSPRDDLWDGDWASQTIPHMGDWKQQHKCLGTYFMGWFIELPQLQSLWSKRLSVFSWNFKHDNFSQSGEQSPASSSQVQES